MLIIFEEHILRSEGDGWHLSLHQMTLGTQSFVVISRDYRHLCQKGLWVASASLRASLVSFNRRSSSCRVIRAGILENCVNMSKRKGVFSPFEGSFFNNLSNRTSFCFPLSSGGDGTETWNGAVVPNVVSCCVSSGVWSYCRKYYFSDWVPYGWEIAGCAAKPSFSSFESLREAIVAMSSFIVREMLLYDLPLSLGMLDSHCSSSTISRWTHMISSDLIIIGTRHLAFCFSSIGLTTSSLALETGVNPSWIVIFGKIPKLRVTIFAVTFFWSDLRVRTLSSTNSWIFSLRTKHLLVGWCTIMWKRQ